MVVGATICSQKCKFVIRGFKMFVVWALYPKFGVFLQLSMDLLSLFLDYQIYTIVNVWNIPKFFTISWVVFQKWLYCVEYK